MAEIHDRLKQARKKLYKSQSEFCEKHGLNERTYASHERGERGIKSDMLKHYSDILGIDHAWLVTGKVGALTDKLIDEKLLSTAMKMADEIFIERGFDITDLDNKSILSGHIYKALLTEKARGSGNELSEGHIDALIENIPTLSAPSTPSLKL